MRLLLERQISLCSLPLKWKKEGKIHDIVFLRTATYTHENCLFRHPGSICIAASVIGSFWNEPSVSKQAKLLLRKRFWRIFSEPFQPAIERRHIERQIEKVLCVPPPLLTRCPTIDIKFKIDRTFILPCKFQQIKSRLFAFWKKGSNLSSLCTYVCGKTQTGRKLCHIALSPTLLKMTLKLAGRKFEFVFSIFLLSIPLNPDLNSGWAVFFQKVWTFQSVRENEK